MEDFSWYSYVAWVPLLLWGALFFWFWRFSNPLFLKKMVRKGNKWAYVPEYISKNPGNVLKLMLANFLFSLVASVASAWSVVWLLYVFHVDGFIFGFVSVPLFLAVAVILYRAAMKKISILYRSAYFLEYRKVRYETEKKGLFRSEPDVNNRAIWSFTKKLKNAEEHRRLWKYVNAMARTKKIPPDIYAETMYV